MVFSGERGRGRSEAKPVEVTAEVAAIAAEAAATVAAEVAATVAGTIVAILETIAAVAAIVAKTETMVGAMTAAAATAVMTAAGAKMPAGGGMTRAETPSTPMATSFEAMAAWTTTVWTPSMPMATSFGATAASMTAWCPRPLNRCQRPAPHTQQGRKQRGWPGPPSLFLWHRHARDTCGQVAPQTRR